jgi:hypothetical protein
MKTPNVTQVTAHGQPHVHPIRTAAVVLPALAALRAVQFYVRNPRG